MYEPLIEVNNLDKYFQTKTKKIYALKDISFKINKGESVGLIGENGSGKTTLLKLISGILHPSKGSITVRGEILPLLELGVGFHPELTGKENIFLYSSILGIPRKVIKTKMDEIIEFSELGDFIEEKLKTYSAGMKLRLAFSIGIQCYHDIFLIDEILAVGDMNFQKKCLRKIRELQNEKRTFLFVSHDLRLINKVCNKVILLNEGRTKFIGDIIEAFCHYKKILKEKRIALLSPQKRKINYIVNWWRGIKQPPFSLEINPSKRCNLQCSFCEFRELAQDKKEELPYTEYEKLIKNAKSLGVSEIRIVGKGEPFVRGDMLKIMTCIKQNKLSGFICTNGLLLKEEMIKTLIEYKWDRIEISLHGSSSKIHDRLVNKKGIFDKILRNIRLIKKFKTVYRTNKPFIGISTVLNKLNYKDIPNIVKLANKLQVDSVSLNPLIINKYNKNLQMTDKEIKEFRSYLKKSKKLIKKYKLDTNYDNLTSDYIKHRIKIPNFFRKNNSVLYCYFPWLYLAIDQNGCTSHCTFHKGTESIKIKSLNDIWYGKKFEKIRVMFKKGIPFQECNNCCIPYVIENNFIKKDMITYLNSKEK